MQAPASPCLTFFPRLPHTRPYKRASPPIGAVNVSIAPIPDTRGGFIEDRYPPAVSPLTPSISKRLVTRWLLQLVVEREPDMLTLCGYPPRAFRGPVGEM